MKNIYIITGGTMVHITPHFSVAAPAYGKVGSEIYARFSLVLKEKNLENRYRIFLIKTKMAGLNNTETVEHLKSLNIDNAIETNDDLEAFVSCVSAKTESVGIIMSFAICDFEPEELNAYEGEKAVTVSEFGKDKKDCIKLIH